MDTPANPTPAAPAPATPPTDTVRDALFKSLQLTVMQEDPNPNKGPMPDSGVEVPSTITDFSQKSGSIADVLQSMEKGTPTATVQPATPANLTPSPVVPPVAPVVPPPPAPNAPVPPTAPEMRKLEIPQITKTNVIDDAVLPPPPVPFDLNGLDDDEQNEVQNAIFAEQRYPERYAGLGKKVYDFIKTHKEFVKTQERENPDVSFDGDNQAYQKFLQQNRPNLSVSERKKLERERILEEAAALAERRVSGKAKKLEDEISKLKAEPIIQKTVKDYESFVKDLLPKDDDPLVEQTAKQYGDTAVTAGREFLLLANNISQYDSHNQTHKFLAEFIQEQADVYLKSGHQSLKRGARTFVPRAKFNALPPDERAKHFTFTDEDILQLLAMNAKAATEYSVNNERERLKKAGYVRQASQAPVTPPAPPPVETSPRASVSVAPSSPVVESRETDPFLKYMRSR